MSFLQEKLDIENYFLQQWTETPIYYENDLVDQPEDEWLRLSIVSGEGRQVTLGNCDTAEVRHVGVLILQFFVKIDTGSGRALELADLAYDMFKNKRVSNIQFRVPEIQKLPIDRDLGWYQVNLSVAFYRG